MTAKLKRLLEASSSSRHPSSHVSIHTALTSTQGGAPQLAGRPHGTRARLAGAHRARGFASRLRRGRATRDLGAPVGRACGRRGQAGDLDAERRHCIVVPCTLETMFRTHAVCHGIRHVPSRDVVMPLGWHRRPGSGREVAVASFSPGDRERVLELLLSQVRR